MVEQAMILAKLKNELIDAIKSLKEKIKKENDNKEYKLFLSTFPK